jgi:hypothetical protein
VTARVAAGQRALEGASGTSTRRPGVTAVVLPVVVVPTRTGAEQADREHVALAVLVDLEPLRGRVAPETGARFTIRMFAKPPHGATMSHEVEVRSPKLPAEGKLHYEASLVVPPGTSGYAVEVREVTTGAFGAAGPVDVVPGAGNGAGAGHAVEAPAPPEARLRSARVLLPEAGAPAAGSILLSWHKRDRPVAKVTGGEGSSLELGVAVDLSAALAPERAAFERAAATSVSRVLGPTDRVFRVDIGEVPAFIGAMRGGPGDLFADGSATSHPSVALLDGVRFALDCFAGTATRAALVVITDGHGVTGLVEWRDLAALARARAIPVFVVIAGQSHAVPSGPLAMPAETEITEAMRLPASATVGYLDLPDLETGQEVKAQATARMVLATFAAAAGGSAAVFGEPHQVASAWDALDGAIRRIWRVEFEPTDPHLDPGEVEVHLASGRVVRPGA